MYGIYCFLSYHSPYRYVLASVNRVDNVNSILLLLSVAAWKIKAKEKRESVAKQKYVAACTVILSNLPESTAAKDVMKLTKYVLAVCERKVHILCVTLTRKAENSVNFCVDRTVLNCVLPAEGFDSVYSLRLYFCPLGTRKVWLMLTVHLHREPWYDIHQKQKLLKRQRNWVPLS